MQRDARFAIPGVACARLAAAAHKRSRCSGLMIGSAVAELVPCITDVAIEGHAPKPRRGAGRQLFQRTLSIRPRRQQQNRPQPAPICSFSAAYARPVLPALAAPVISRRVNPGPLSDV